MSGFDGRYNLNENDLKRLETALQHCIEQYPEYKQSFERTLEKIQDRRLWSTKK